jgi:hypothetical protein
VHIGSLGRTPWYGCNAHMEFVVVGAVLLNYMTGCLVL